jgi:hypothetical protein
MEASFFSSIARVCRITGGPVSRPVSGIKFAGREGQSPCHHEFPRFLSSSHHGFSSTPFLEAEQCRLCKRWPSPPDHPPPRMQTTPGSHPALTTNLFPARDCYSREGESWGARLHAISPSHNTEFPAADRFALAEKKAAPARERPLGFAKCPPGGHFRKLIVIAKGPVPFAQPISRHGWSISSPLQQRPFQRTAWRSAAEPRGRSVAAWGGRPHDATGRPGCELHATLDTGCLLNFARFGLSPNKIAPALPGARYAKGPSPTRHRTPLDLFPMIAVKLAFQILK